MPGVLQNAHITSWAPECLKAEPMDKFIQMQTAEQAQAWEVWRGHRWHPLLWQICKPSCSVAATLLVYSSQCSNETPHPSLTNEPFVVDLRCSPYPAHREDFGSPYLWGRFADWLGWSWWTPSEGTLSFHLFYFCLFAPSLIPPTHVQRFSCLKWETSLCWMLEIPFSFATHGVITSTSVLQKQTFSPYSSLVAFFPPCPFCAMTAIINHE